MKANKFDVVHLSGCCTKMQENGEKYLCPNIAKIAGRLEEMGIEVVNGTHH